MPELRDNQSDWVRWTLASVPVMALVTALLSTQRHALGLVQGDSAPFSESLFWYAFQWGPWMMLAPLMFWLLFRWPLRGHAGQRIVSFHLPRVAFAGLGIVGLHTAVQATLKVVFFDEFADRSFADAYGYLFLAKAHAEYLVFLVIAGLVYGARLAQRYRTEKNRAAELGRLYDRHRLESLRQQLAPHFLFNALNSLCSMLEEDSAPHRMTIAIGQFLRQVVDQRDLTTTLGNELQMVRSYLTIQQMRFGDRLNIDIDVGQDCLACHLPTLILQPLVENAIVHGVARLTGPACVSIEARCVDRSCVITIQNDAPTQNPPKPAGSPDAVRNRDVRWGRGLTLLSELLTQCYASHAGLETRWLASNRFAAKLTLPLQTTGIGIAALESAATTTGQTA